MCLDVRGCVSVGGVGSGPHQACEEGESGVAQGAQLHPSVLELVATERRLLRGGGVPRLAKLLLEVSSEGLPRLGVVRWRVLSGGVRCARS